MNSGIQLAFDAVNAQGGVHGRKIRLVTLDDELAPPKAVANYKKPTRSRAGRDVRLRGLRHHRGRGQACWKDSGCAVGGRLRGGRFGAREDRSATGFFVRASTGREAEVLVRQLTTIGIDDASRSPTSTTPAAQEALTLVTQGDA